MNAEVSMLDVLSHTALKGVAVLAVALVVGVLLHRMAAARRYAIWITAVGALALLPPAMLLLPAWRVLPQAGQTVLESPGLSPEEIIESREPATLPVEANMTPSAASLETPAPGPAAIHPVPSRQLSWQDIAALLPSVWLAISTLLLLRLAWGAARLHRLEKTLSPGTCALLAEVSHEVGLKHAPRLLIGAENAVPMVWGVWRPRLLLPLGFETWGREKLRGVLLHELAHLKRRDPLALWTAQWVKALHWFNPLAWLILRQLRADQERACDDTVLLHGVRPSDYAQHLLDLSRHARLAPGLALCALTITRCAPVESRVKAILDPKRSRDGLTQRWLAGLAALALLTTLPVAMLHAAEAAKLRGRILDRNGVVLAETTEKKMRNYPLKALAAQMVGYGGQSKSQAGMEKQHDTELAAGKDVTLTLDMRTQSIALRAMTEAGITRGAAVVLDPRTGEVLAAVSLPSYDPNQFVPSINQEKWQALLENSDLPLLNRCLRGFAPGSTYKLLPALAGCAAGISGQKFNCTGSVTYGNTAMKCWIQRQNGGGHGLLGMTDSLAVSCNCYWYQFGNTLGIERIEGVGRKIGFGSDYGIMDEEDKGILPSPAWLKQHLPKERWTQGFTANTSIGQGFVLATPLQMAVLAATVGNGGRVPRPAAVKQQEPGAWLADLTQETPGAADMQPVREGMRLAVNGDSGTGRPARSEKVVIAGKTGTAQNWRSIGGSKVADNHGWFIGFAPYDKPTLAFAVLKSGAKSGGGDCGPVAKRIVEETLALPTDGSGEVRPVEPPARDGDKAAIMDEIGRQAAALGENFKLEELQVEEGKIVLTGKGMSVSQVLSFLDRLKKLGESHNIQWAMPVPTVQNDNTATFRAVGTPQAQAAPDGGKTVENAPQEPPAKADKDKAAREEMARLILQLQQTQEKIKELEKQINTGASATLEQPHEALVQQKKKLLLALEKTLAASRSKTIATSKMRPEDKERLRRLRLSEGLADIPAEAVMCVTDLPDRLFWDFRFALPQEAAHRWLVASLSPQEQAGHKEELNWPANGEAFQRVFRTHKGCSIHIRYQGGGMVDVTVWKSTPLFVPDEVTPPTPKELEGVANVSTSLPNPS